MTNNLFQALAEAARANQPVALGIITGVKGSSPQKLGAKALFHPDRKIQGTLGGGCLEAEAQRLALQSLRDGKPQTFELVLDHDFGWDDGLICGGKVFGVIIPNAQAAGETFWNELAKRDATKSWGVRNDFTLAHTEDSPLPALSPSDGERVAEGRERGTPLDADGQPWTAARLQAALDAYYVDHERLCLEPNARNARHTYVVPAEDKKSWRVQQMLVDPEEHNDWVAEFDVDLAASRQQNEPVLRLRRIGSLT